MKIKLINFNYEQAPFRAHDNDAGADVYAPINMLIRAGRTEVLPLGFGVEIPDGYVGFIYPRSGLSAKGVVCELPPIDSTYRGQIHAIITNHSCDDVQIKKGDRVGQLVVMPCAIPDFVTEIDAEGNRDQGAFGSTGK